MNETLYIGKYEVVGVFDDKDDDKLVNVELMDGKDEKNVKMNKELFDLVKKPVKTNSDISEAVYLYIADKFVKDLAKYGIERYQVESIAAYMGNLIHNWTENKIGEFFGCSNSDHIKISDIIEND